jgi:hypothetical protein
MALKVNGDLLLAETETAQKIERTPRTLKRWRDLREGPPFVRIGRKIYYRERALHEWILKREATGAAA